MFASQRCRITVPACGIVLWVTPVPDLTCRFVLKQRRLVIDRQQLIGVTRKNLQHHIIITQLILRFAEDVLKHDGKYTRMVKLEVREYKSDQEKIMSNAFLPVVY